jgi:hypothetical protein
MGCTSIYETSSTVTIVDAVSNDDARTPYTSAVGPGEAVMWAVAVMYQPSDLYVFPSANAPVLFST